MRQAIQLVVVGLIADGVWSCGVTETYERLKAGSRWAIEKVGL